MKAYFTRLFNYDRYANLLIVSAIQQTKEPEKAEQLMAHMLAAQQIWMNRCKGEPAIGSTLWPDWKADTFEEMINDNHRKWVVFLEKLNNSDFERLISYKSLRGDGFKNKLIDILGHVINHGTHHRAQA
ncbi:MAG TPA: DinB family protein, partial [Mucilaginibacter sp.]|nr:DinB family protein [Mucilaginibacter sp.]